MTLISVLGGEDRPTGKNNNKMTNKYNNGTLKRSTMSNIRVSASFIQSFTTVLRLNPSPSSTRDSVSVVSGVGSPELNMTETSRQDLTPSPHRQYGDVSGCQFYVRYESLTCTIIGRRKTSSPGSTPYQRRHTFSHTHRTGS